MNTPYNTFNSYCLRTPLFPMSFIQDIYKNTDCKDDDYFDLLKNKIFYEALFIASPELYSQIKNWQKGTIKETNKIERLQYAILKYATRMSARCTPFGLFASCTIGTFSADTQIQLKPIAAYKRITRLDMSFLSLIIQEALQTNHLKETTKFFTNTSLYLVGDHYRYIEYALDKNKRKYTLEGFPQKPYLDKLINDAKEGRTIHQLATDINDANITLKEAKNFVIQLIENQVLISELELKITGDDFFTDFIEKLPTSYTSKKDLLFLQKAINQLDDEFGNPISSYANIIEHSKKSIQEFNPKHLLQTDCFTAFHQNTLSYQSKKQLKKALKVFNKITMPSSNKNLEEFKRDFKKRYDTNKVPLNLVLDAETGIGYGSKSSIKGFMIDDFVLSGKRKKDKNILWSDFDALLFDKYSIALQNNDYSIVFNDIDFKDFSENWDDLPDTVSGIAEVYSKNNGHQLFFNGVFGGSATKLLGRFGHGNTQLIYHIHEIVEVEEQLNRDKILAEIVHLPEARTGNVLQRPAIRKHEIPYLGNASVGVESQIQVDDVLVSVRNNRIVLTSKKLKKEIVPMLGNAHNYKFNSLPLYQFLCELHTDNKRGMIGFRWNSIFLNNAFLPRVAYGNLIFSKARWTVKVAVLKELLNSKENSKRIKQWRNTNKLPQYVELVEGDNKLLIDLKNQTSLKMLFDSVKKKNQFVIEEFLFQEDEIVKRNQESFSNQFVVSFYNEAKLKSVENE